MTAEGQTPLPSTLATKQHNPLLEIDVIAVETAGLREAGAHSLEQFEQSCVPEPLRRLGRAGGLDDGHDALVRNGLG